MIPAIKTNNVGKKNGANSIVKTFSDINIVVKHIALIPEAIKRIIPPVLAIPKEKKLPIMAKPNELMFKKENIVNIV